MRDNKKNSDIHKVSELANTTELPKADNLSEETDTSDIEGYAYCSTTKQKCLNDCNGTPVILPLN